MSNFDIDLIAAVYNNDINLIRNLVFLDANVNLRNSEGLTPLGMAVKAEHAEALCELIRLGANIEATQSTEKSTVLLMATDVDWISGVEILLEAGASMYTKNTHGVSAYVLAHEDKHWTIKRMFDRHVNSSINGFQKFQDDVVVHTVFDKGVKKSVTLFDFSRQQVRILLDNDNPVTYIFSSFPDPDMIEHAGSALKSLGGKLEPLKDTATKLPPPAFKFRLKR